MTTAHTKYEHKTLAGPHGPLLVRTYRTSGIPGASLVWAHGGSFVGGDLDSAESHWVASELAARGIEVTTVNYQLAPVPKEWEPILGRRAGVHYPVASEELAFAFSFVARSLSADHRCFIGGASAGGDLAASATLRLLNEDRLIPTGVVLAYPLLHYIIPPADPELDARLLELPEAERFTPEAVAIMNNNYLGTMLESDSPYAFPGGKNLAGFPPTLIINSDLDGLRPSGEAFAAELIAAGTSVDVSLEPGTRHGHLSTPEVAGASRTIERMIRWMH